MKLIYMKRILIDVDNGDEFTIIMNRPDYDYLYYARFYRSKNGKTYGNWRGLSHYTNASHAIRGFRRYHKGRTFKVVKNAKSKPYVVSYNQW